MTIKFHKKLVRTPGFPWFLREISAFTQQNSDLIGVLLSYSSSASVVVSTLDSWSEIPGSNPTFAKLCSLFKYLSMKFKKWKGGRGMGSSPTAAKWYAKAQIGPLCPGMLCLALPSFASSAQCVIIGLSKWIFYVKNHLNFSDFFFFIEE